MSTVPETRRFSVQEYLAREEGSAAKHEFYRGEIFAMAGATIPHNIIAGNVFAHLHTALRGKGCRPFGSDQRIKVEKVGLFTYSDTSVICGDVERPKDDPHAAINLRVIVEVLSESTEAYDRGRKFRFYQQIAGLQEYILIAQDEPRIEKFVRGVEGQRIMSSVAGLDASLELSSVGCQLPLSEVFDGVTLRPAESTIDQR